MMSFRPLGLAWLSTSAWLLMSAATTVAQERPTPPQPGHDFQSAETRAVQDDEARNPGMLWVEQGAKLWSEPAGEARRSCATCHKDAETSMKGVAARFPRASLPANAPTPAQVTNLEGQINACRTRQDAPPLAYESNELLGLTAYVSYQSRGIARQLPHSRTPDAAHAAALQNGRTFYQTRQGQLNLSCGQCHDDMVGRKLRGDTISQGQTEGWPAYRLEWQAMGSLHRRLRACSLGVRAEILPYGSPEYLALEYYLAWRGEGLPLSSPGVRR